MTRSTPITVAAALPAGILLAVIGHVIGHGLAHVHADSLDMAVQIVTFTGGAAAGGSAGWYGVKAAIERHEDTVRRSRRRRAPDPLPRQRPRTAPPLTISGTDAAATAAGEHQALADALQGERAQRPAYVDPYLTRAAVDTARAPAAVDADGYPAPGPAAHAITNTNAGDSAIADLEARLRAWSPAAP